MADPRDPQCCTVPQCVLIPPNATPTPGIVTPPVPYFGSFTGGAQNPTPRPTPVPTTIINGQVVIVTPKPGESTMAPPTPQPGTKILLTLNENMLCDQKVEKNHFFSFHNFFVQTLIPIFLNSPLGIEF